jgi:F0F1-type ATP synthase assembly protein I
MDSRKPPKAEKKDYLFNATTAVVLGQVGFLTLVIILVSVGAGLWLDQHFATRPLFTLILVLGSIPISLILTVRTVKRALSRQSKATRSQGEDEDND